MAEKFTVFESFYESSKDMTAEEFKSAWCALFEYAFHDEDTEDLEGAAKMFYVLTKPVVSRSVGISEAREKAGKKGGKANAKQNKILLKANAKQNDDLLEADKEKDKDIGIRNKDIGNRIEDKGEENTKRTAAQMVAESDLSDPTKESTMDWLAYKHERRFSYKETSLRTLLKQVRQKELDYGQEYVRSCIETSISNGYQGIIWKERASPRPSNSWDNA